MNSAPRILLAIAGSTLLLFGQDPELKARELFYSPAKMVAKPAAANPPAAPAAAKSVAKAETKPAAAKSPSTPDAAVAAAKGPFQNASVTTANQPLGLRYSIVQRMRNGVEREVDPETVFRTGEQIRLRVESNDAGYLYIAQKGSKGNWNLLFPSPEINGGKNKVTPYRKYEIPNEDVFEFSSPAGEFKIFIALTRQPEPDFERFLSSLEKGAKPGTSTAPAKGEILALNVLDDRLIGEVRGKLVARDLVVSRVKRQNDVAGYAVNASGKSDARVVAELALKQQD